MEASTSGVLAGEHGDGSGVSRRLAPVHQTPIDDFRGADLGFSVFIPELDRLLDGRPSVQGDDVSGRSSGLDGLFRIQSP